MITLNCLKKSFVNSWTFLFDHFMLIPGNFFRMKSVAISALYFDMSFFRNKNCLFRFDNSIVSKSITNIFLMPNRARFLIISQPKPPAPTTKI